MATTKNLMKLCSLTVAMLLGIAPAMASNVNGINGGMPNRISMNVTVPKQTQGATFGEKVSAGLHAAGSALAQGASTIVIECGQDACALAFPDGTGYRADTTQMTLQPLAKGQVEALRKGGPRQSQGASLLGGALPGGAVISAAVSSVGSLGGAGGGAAAASYARSGAAAASYAATGRVSAAETPLRASINPQGEVDVLDVLQDGDYLVTLVVAKASGGLKDTLKTQVRAAVTQQVRIEVGFSVEAGVLKTKHDTAKNSVGNIR